MSGVTQAMVAAVQTVVDSANNVLSTIDTAGAKPRTESQPAGAGCRPPLPEAWELCSGRGGLSPRWRGPLGERRRPAGWQTLRQLEAAGELRIEGRRVLPPPAREGRYVLARSAVLLGCYSLFGFVPLF